MITNVSRVSAASPAPWRRHNSTTEKTSESVRTIDFDSPEIVVDIETVDNRAGVSRWTRQEMERYRFLHID